jgi:hypothetical protein
MPSDQKPKGRRTRMDPGLKWTDEIPLKEVHLHALRYCHWHPNVVARYDAVTVYGLWSYMCADCFPITAASQELGTGKGQRIIYEGNAALIDESRGK